MGIEQITFDVFKDIIDNMVTMKVKKDYIFDRLTPYIVDELLEIMIRDRTSSRGRQVYSNLFKIVRGVYDYIDSGFKTKKIKEYVGCSIDTFYRYFEIIKVNEIFKRIWQQFLTYIPLHPLTIVDSMCVKSNFGNHETSFFFKQKGKKGVKITLLVGVNKIIYAFDVVPANIDDRPAFTSMMNKFPLNEKTTVLADSGYSGKELKRRSKLQKMDVLSVPRKNNQGVYTRRNTNYDRVLLFKKRAYVEHINSIIASYSGIEIKNVKSIKNFKVHLSLAVLLTTIATQKRIGKLPIVLHHRK